MRGDRERFLEAGFDGYLSKPVDVGELLAIGATALRRRPMSARILVVDDVRANADSTSPSAIVPSVAATTS